MTSRKMQNVKFGSVAEFLDYLPEEELVVVEALRELWLETIPHVKEKLSYNVPFYRGKLTLGFIWPASVLWGSKASYTGVRLGFSKGYLMDDPEGFLAKGTRKQVYMRDFQTLEEIDPDMIRFFLFQAVELDQV